MVILLVIAIRLLLIGLFVSQLMVRIIFHVIVIFLFLFTFFWLPPPLPSHFFVIALLLFQVILFVTVILWFLVSFLLSKSSGFLSHFCDRFPLKVLCLIFMISILYGSLSLSSASSTSSLAYCDNLYFVPNHPSFDPQSLAPGHPSCYRHPLVSSLLNEIAILLFLVIRIVNILSSSLYSLLYLIAFALLTVATIL